MESIFKSNVAEKELAEKGFTVIDAGIAAEVAALKAIIQSDYPLQRAYFCYSLLEFTYEQNKEIRKRFRAVLAKFYESNFTNYKTLNESFLIKPGGKDEELFLHQDFCYTDENRFPSYNVWIPLADVTEQNGAVFVLKGSHNWYNNYRSSSIPTLRTSMKKFPAEKIASVEMKAGQVLLFHPAVFHGSFANLTQQDRAIVTATITHKNADFIYYHRPEGSDDVEEYLLHEDAYLRDLEKISHQGRPDGKLLKQFSYRHTPVSEDDLLEMAKKQN